MKMSAPPTAARGPPYRLRSNWSHSLSKDKSELGFDLEHHPRLSVTPMMFEAMDSRYQIRPVETGDIEELYVMLRELAEFEKLLDKLVGTPEEMAHALLGGEGTSRGLVVEDTSGKQQSPEGTVLVAYAIYFENYSSFMCRRGLYLEDIYVRPAHRRQGIGSALMQYLAGIAVKRKCGRMEWAVLDWNQNAIDVYEALGATVLPDWRLVRLEQAGIAALADRAPDA